MNCLNAWHGTEQSPVPVAAEAEHRPFVPLFLVLAVFSFSSRFFCLLYLRTVVSIGRVPEISYCVPVMMTGLPFVTARFRQCGCARLLRSPRTRKRGVTIICNASHPTRSSFVLSKAGFSSSEAACWQRLKIRSIFLKIIKILWDRSALNLKITDF
jgi:hypothetical protein